MRVHINGGETHCLAFWEPEDDDSVTLEMTGFALVGRLPVHSTYSGPRRYPPRTQK